MHSIESALAQDFTRRGWAIIPLIFLAMFALPLWLLEATGIDQFNSPHEAVVLHVTLTLLMGVAAAVGIFHAQGRLDRFFVRPISAARLVFCQMTLGIATIALMYLGSAALLNLDGAGWPVLGPAMFLAAVLACTLTAVWSFEGSVVWQLVGTTATSVPLLIWFSRCYGARVFGGWQTMWPGPTAVETLTLGGIVAAAYALAIAGVTRARRGDVWNFAALAAWWERQRASGYAAAPFGGPWAAQAWCVWWEKWGFMPVSLVALSMLAAVAAWIAGSMPIDELFTFMLGLPLVLLLAAMPLVYGLLLGNCGKQGTWRMRHVLATRPVTDTFLAHVLLRNCSLALLLTWAAWLVGLAAAAGLVYLTGHSAEALRVLLPPEFETRQMVLLAVSIPLASWTFTSLMAALTATGREWLLIAALCAGFALILAAALTKGLLSEREFEIVSMMWLVLSGALYLTGTAWAFVAALRRRLITIRTIQFAVGAWLILSLLTILAWPANLPASDTWWRSLWLWHAVATLSLSVLPFAAMPLAIRWNRHR